jgi:hypothetical protein
MLLVPLTPKTKCGTTWIRIQWIPGALPPVVMCPSSSAWNLTSTPPWYSPGNRNKFNRSVNKLQLSKGSPPKKFCWFLVSLVGSVWSSQSNQASYTKTEQPEGDKRSASVSREEEGLRSILSCRNFPSVLFRNNDTWSMSVAFWWWQIPAETCKGFTHIKTCCTWWNSFGSHIRWDISLVQLSTSWRLWLRTTFCETVFATEAVYSCTLWIELIVHICDRK